MTSAGRIVLTLVFGAGLLAAPATGQTPASPPPGAAPAPAAAQAARGEALFNQRCQTCHDPAIEGAPNRADLAAFDPAFVVGVLKQGEMKPMAQGLSDDDLQALAAFLTSY